MIPMVADGAVWLVLAVVCSTINHLLFKAFARFRIDLLAAIVANFAACVAIGYGSSTATLFRGSVRGQGWYSFSIVQGSVFVACLFLLGWTTEKQGVAVASLATRLSVAIPTVAAFILYADSVTTAKVTGILVGILALYLSCADRADPGQPPRASSVLPVGLFAVFGAYSTLIKFVQERFLDRTSYHAYVMCSFLTAFLISGSVLGWRVVKRQQSCGWKDVIWGLGLGCANYGSVFFLIRTLGVVGWQSSQIFPTVSVAVVSMSSLGAFVLFNERWDRRMSMALALGVGSMVLVNR